MGELKVQIRVIIRLWKKDKMIREQHLLLRLNDLEGLVPKLAAEHAESLVGSPHMIEIEFPDEPDPNERFFRFGTDPSRMVTPIGIKLGTEGA